MTKYIVLSNDVRVEFLSSAAAEAYATANNIDPDSVSTEAFEAADTLSESKSQRCAQVDAKTQQLVALGFTFAAEQFSLSSNAQINWLGLKALESLLSFPVQVTTLADGSYELASADLDTFVGTAAATVKAHLDSGRAIKGQILACETEGELAAVEDAR